MKYTSLFSAVAVAAAMGTQAFATVTTNDVGSVNFEASEYVAGRLYEVPGVSGLGWTVSSEDNSAIIAAPLSQPGMEAVDGFAGKHLELSTEGQELVYNPGTVSQPKSLIEMKVRLVASETAPAIDATDTTVHAAVYLKADENDPTTDGLYAYAQVDGAAAWTNIANAVSLPGLANGSMLALRVLMDYGAQQATYEGAILADAENAGDIAYVILATTDMANPDKNVTALSTLAFKGTGGVDDLFVKEIEETASTASIDFEACDEGDLETTVDSGSGTLDIAAAGSVCNFSISDFGDYSAPTMKSIQLFDVTSGSTELTWTVEPIMDSEGNLAVTMANFAFLAEHSYLIKVVMGTPVVSYTVTFTTEYGTAPAAQTVESGSVASNPGAPVYEGTDYRFVQWTLNGSAYNFATPVNGAITLVAEWEEVVAVTGVEFGTFAIQGESVEFTAFSVEGSTATATLTGNIVSTGTETSKTFYALYKTSLDETAYHTVAATAGTPTVGEEGSVTVTFTLPAGNSLFLCGFTNEAAATAGE